MRRAFILLAGMVCCVPDVSALAQAAASESPAQAFYEFMMARRLEGDGDTAGALSALERARKLDPKSSEVLAEIAGLQARLNKADEALKAANEAVAIDADNVEAHRVIALVYSAWAEGIVPGPPGQSPASLRDKAIASLERIQDSPAMATDLNLQVTYGRMLVRGGRQKDAI